MSERSVLETANELQNYSMSLKIRAISRKLQCWLIQVQVIGDSDVDLLGVREGADGEVDREVDMIVRFVSLPTSNNPTEGL